MVLYVSPGYYKEDSEQHNAKKANHRTHSLVANILKDATIDQASKFICELQCAKGPGALLTANVVAFIKGTQDANQEDAYDLRLRPTPTTYAYDLRLRPTPTTYAFRPHNSSTLTIELGNLNTETQEHNTHTQQYKETSGSHINLLYFPLLTTSITAATDLFSTLLPITTPLTPLFLLSSSSSSQSLAHLTLSCPLPLPQPATKDSDLPCHLDPHFSRIRPFL
ncbi:hypothetical protein PG999_013843 [Apiospora kogelbergensis]|uniref:Uncharacterized protein n=1 Tax=Apiospora kogelbergensis TaxID=1337665 RepID=A0AAW0Q5B2_9PEZI